MSMKNFKRMETSGTKKSPNPIANISQCRDKDA